MMINNIYHIIQYFAETRLETAFLNFENINKSSRETKPQKGKNVFYIINLCYFFLRKKDLAHNIDISWYKSSK